MAVVKQIVVVVCGGRDYSDAPELFRVLDEFDQKYNIGIVVDGASDDVTGPYKGADYWANQWAKARGKATVRVRAKWSSQGRAAGPIRNQKMLERYRPHLVIHFPGGAGTANMVKLAKQAKVKTLPAFKWMRS